MNTQARGGKAPPAQDAIVVVGPPPVRARSREIRSSLPLRRRRSLHQRLRGRYRWMVLAIVVGAVVGSGLTWSLLRPMHRAVATLAIEPSRHAAAASDRIDAITGQVLESLRSPATLEKAAPIARHRLIADRSSEAKRQIIVRYDDTNPAAAVAGMGRILDAAVIVSGLFEHESVLHQIDELRRRVDADQTTLEELQALHRQAVEAFGMLPLDQRIADRRRELDQMVVQLREIELTLAATEEEEGIVKPPFDKLRGEGQALPAGQGRWAAVVRQVLEALPQAPAVVTVVDLDGVPVAPMMVKQLKARQAGLESMRGVVSGELGELIAKAATINALQRKVTESVAALDAAQRRIDELAAMDAAVARLWVLDRGEQAGIAEPQAYYGTLGGGGVVGAVVCMGLAVLMLASDRRLRRSDQVAAGPDDPPVLGAVPTLIQRDRDEQSDRLAQAVHEVRSILEVHADNHGARVFAITSPSRGSGKTSLTVGLGTSLAMSGSRTLIIDVDLAARVAQHETVDQVMLDLGHVEDDKAALVKSSEQRGRGLAGMLDGLTLPQSVMHTKVRGLDVLHAHAVDAGQVGRISSRFLAAVFAQAKAAYDLVLIDAGPVPGGVEGMLATAAADGVIIVVQRNESQQQYDRALSHLRLVEASVIGCVFNRADERDVTVTAGRRTVRSRQPNVDTGSGILAAAVQAHAGSAFDRAEPITPAQVMPVPNLTAAPILDDHDVRVASAADTDEWEVELEASLDRLINEVSAPPQRG